MSFHMIIDVEVVYLFWWKKVQGIECFVVQFSSGLAHVTPPMLGILHEQKFHKLDFPSSLESHLFRLYIFHFDKIFCTCENADVNIEELLDFIFCLAIGALKFRAWLEKNAKEGYVRVYERAL